MGRPNGEDTKSLHYRPVFSNLIVGRKREGLWSVGNSSLKALTEGLKSHQRRGELNCAGHPLFTPINNRACALAEQNQKLYLKANCRTRAPFSALMTFRCPKLMLGTRKHI